MITCPTCGGEPIAVEIPEVYDGVLYWICLGCGGAWSGWPTAHPRHVVAERYMGQYRLGVETERARIAAQRPQDATNTTPVASRDESAAAGRSGGHS